VYRFLGPKDQKLKEDQNPNPQKENNRKAMSKEKSPKKDIVKK
jgi:hypothetical protein